MTSANHSRYLILFMGMTLCCLLANAAAEQPPDLFTQVWQVVGDEFYDPQLNGVNWDQAKQRYERRVKAASDLESQAAVINEMYSHRQRRAGQLVLSGGGGWVYLRGDRESPDEALLVEVL